MDRLKLMGTFIQIAKSGSLARAASELGMSRSLASSHLKQLESHLGVLLVKRTTRALVLTEAGDEYLKSCRDLLDALVASEGRLADVQEQAAGHLKVMASMAFGSFHLGPLIMSFTGQHPDIRVSLILLDRGFSASDFLAGDFDLAVSMDYMKDGSIISSKIGDTRWVPCVGRNYFDGHAPIRNPRDLVDHRCLVHRSYASDSIWRFQGPEEASEVRVTGPLFTNSVTVLRDAVISGRGGAMLPLYAVHDDIEEGRIKRILLKFTSSSRPVFLVYQESRYLPHRVRLFIAYLKGELKQRTL